MSLPTHKLGDKCPYTHTSWQPSVPTHIQVSSLSSCSCGAIQMECITSCSLVTDNHGLSRLVYADLPSCHHYCLVLTSWLFDCPDLEVTAFIEVIRIKLALYKFFKSNQFHFLVRHCATSFNISDYHHTLALYDFNNSTFSFV